MPKMKAVVLLSGGLDSTTTLAIATHENYEVYAISFDYGQRNQLELQAAMKVAQQFKVREHKIIKIDLRQIGGSALTDTQPVPKGRTDAQIAAGIPITYVPARNTIFLALALGWAETIQAFHIFIGVNAIDYSGYPDCRPEYIQAFETMANLATRAGTEISRFQIHTPIIHLSKVEIVQKGILLGVDYSQTLSCYDPAADGQACGECDSCLLRARAFQAAGLAPNGAKIDTTTKTC